MSLKGENMADIYESGENYLETILVLGKKGDVRSIDIVRDMSLSKPSVSRAMGILKKNGYIEIDKKGYISLTESGRDIAEKIYERHLVLTRWLMSIGVPEEIASEDACKLEHAISAESFDKLKEHLDKHHGGI